ncbi:hypothetical protein DB30_04749 [Enhygromyxa salina]|uniref:Lipoprotein n=1 Tax=Enhygromyxa salina TaxID=215803 RepID=A0A0C1ZF72_9BACT|nr:hypothetical protein [Enhygromyxa salina]KIG16289.1 hypothetical protein DB30_04749 [Enhygromyxa salina]
MCRRWVLMLSAVFVLACKREPSHQPNADARPSTSHYGEAAFATSVQPMQVCEHLARMFEAENGHPEAKVDPRLLADCDHELRIEAATRGSANWNEIATCVLQAQTDDELEACDQRYPMPGNATALPASTEREQAACDHMFDIVMQETAEELGTAPPTISAQERQDLTDECVELFMVEHRPNLDDDSYARLLGCLTHAETGIQMQQCEGN